MELKRPIAFLATVLVLVSASLATAGIPDLHSSSAGTVATAGVSKLVCPQGDGTRFDDPVFKDGKVDATIWLNLLDINLDPVVGYPAVDMWLVANGMCLCPNGSVADQATDINGDTTFSGALRAGGCSDDNSLNVYINPYGVLDQAGMAIWVNSPDMNCDLLVNLSDLSMFAQAYFGAYTYCADFHYDGVLDLSDVVQFSSHYSHTCP